MYMFRDGRGCVQHVNVLRRRVDNRDELFDILEVAQGLDTASRSARADGNEVLRSASYDMNALGIVWRGDGTLNKREIVWPIDHGARGLEEVGDLDFTGHRQQLVFAVQQAQLAPIAGREFPDRQFGFLLTTFTAHIISPLSPAGAAPGCTGRPGRPCRQSAARTGSARTGQRRTSCCAPSKRRSVPQPGCVSPVPPPCSAS